MRQPPPNPEPTADELASVRNESDHDAERPKNGALAKKITYLPNIHRLLPQSPEAEQGVLGSITLFPGQVLGMCAEKRIDSGHFHHPAHAEIFVAMRALHDANKLIDFATLAGYLRDRNKLEAVGGAPFVSSVFMMSGGVAANAGYHIEIIQEKYVLREIIRVCTEYAARSYDEQDQVPALLDGAEKEILAIRSDLDSDVPFSFKAEVVGAIGDIQRSYENRGTISGLETGFSELDRLMDGLQPELIIIGARSSAGKTALALNLAEFVAVESKKAVGIFSLEMSRRQLVHRLLSSYAKVNAAAVRNGFLSERDFPALTAAATKLIQANVQIDDSSEMSIGRLRAKARRMKREHNISLLVVDYLQLLGVDQKRRNGNREQEVGEVSGGLKALQRELNIPVIALCQIGRDYEKRGGGRPRLSDIRESDKIGQDADTVMFIVRPEMHAEDDEEIERLRGKAELIIVKRRNGPTGQLALTFLHEFTRFETRATGDYEEESQPDLPMGHPNERKR